MYVVRSFSSSPFLELENPVGLWSGCLLFVAYCIYRLVSWEAWEAIEMFLLRYNVEQKWAFIFPFSESNYFELFLFSFCCLGNSGCC